MSDMQFASGVRLIERAPSTTITIEEGQVAAILQRGKRPIVVVFGEPGEYDVDAQTVADDAVPVWPIVILAIPEAHSRAFADMSQDKVDAICAGAA